MKKYSTNIMVLGILMLFSFRVFSQSELPGKYFISFDGTKIYYEVKGAGYPVLLIHGFTGTGEGWKKNAVYGDLLNAGYQVIIFDQRGNGRSDRPHNEAAYANDAEARDIIGLISKLAIKHYDVVGYSRGSIITARLLVLDKRVHKAVIGGMGDAFTNPEWTRRIHIYQALMGDTSLHDVDSMLKYIHSQRFDELALAYQQKYQPTTGKPELEAIHIPVLIIRGTEDKENGSETELHTLIPSSGLSYVPGDHGGAAKTPEFSLAVRSFLKE